MNPDNIVTSNWQPARYETERWYWIARPLRVLSKWESPIEGFIEIGTKGECGGGHECIACDK